MRFILPGYAPWYVTSMWGEMYLAKTNNVSGRWNVICSVDLINGTEAHLRVPSDINREALKAQATPADIDTHLRLCFNVGESLWRFHDEERGVLLDDHILSMEGIIGVDWFDSGSHIFHTGPVKFDSIGVAHFYPRE